MDARIYDAKGNVWLLPVLLSWSVSHGFCSPCDCFTVSFLYSPEMLEPLKAACRFAADEGGHQVFYGVVDELELSADDGGCLATLRGRGLQALLLDSQAESADYVAADLQFLLDQHVYPLGVTAVDTAGASAGKGVSLSVRSGESHWSVLRRFCEFCLGLRPRFRPDGTLVLDGADSGRLLRLGDDNAVAGQRYVQERYGVLSQVVVKNRSWGSRVVVEDPEFKEMGGQASRVVNVPRRTWFDAMRHTGQYQLTQSKRDLVQCRITLPECFAAFPGDRVQLDGSPLGIKGSFVVENSRSFANARGAGTVLEMHTAG